MSMWSRLIGREKKADGFSDAPFEEWFKFMGGVQSTKSKIPITHISALRVTAAAACCRRWAEAISVPCKLYRKDEKGNRIEVSDHPLTNILSFEPNEYQSAIEFRETIGFHLALTGNAYCLKTTVRGEIDTLVPLVPQFVFPKYDTDNKIIGYSYRPSNHASADLSPDEVWHLRGPSWNTAIGLEPVVQMREALALSLAAEETHALLHANGMKQSGLIKVKDSLNPTQLVRLAAFAQAQYGGAENIGKIMVMDRDADFKPITIGGADAEHLEMRRFQVEDVCRGFGVLPIIIGFADKTMTFASTEQMLIHHMVHMVRPLQNRVESSIERWLLTPKERKQGLYVDFKEEDFLSPAMKDKAEYRRTALGGSGNPGWLTPNEVRAMDELNAIEGGDSLYAPSNIGPVDGSGIPQVPSSGSDANANTVV